MTVATNRNLLFGPEYSMTRLNADRAGTKVLNDIIANCPGGYESATVHGDYPGGKCIR